MSRIGFFLVTSAAILFLERILSALTHWPIFIFPVFVFLFMLSSKRDVDESLYVIGVSFIFDFFSGYHFGFFTLVITFMTVAIFFFKTRFSINHQSLFSLAINCFIFVFVYFAILSVGSNMEIMLDQAFFIITETVIVFLIFNLLLRHLKY